jgi:carboxypeptidase family protein
MRGETRIGGQTNMKIQSAARSAPLFAFLLVCALVSANALAQDNKGQAQLRTVHGTVVDKNDNPAPTSVVYLLNSKTEAVKTTFADDKGAYRFSGLDPNVDYEIHAERQNMASPARKISNFDSRRDIDMTLKLSREKGGS